MSEVRVFKAAQVLPFLDDLARLRTQVFADFPYLYHGDAEYERRYLRAYAESPHSVFVLAFDAGRVVGASTGLPLRDDGDEFQQPFRQRGMALDSVFYFGESVLLPEHRGQGLGHRFFDLREAHARALGSFDCTAFCAVQRAPDDPRRPPGHRDNDRFWRGRGYQPQPDMLCRLRWREHDQDAETPHTLMFWLRPLEARSPAG